MEKRNTLDQRFINLRQVFHDFQTSVRFSTSNSPSQIFANHLKSYEFLGQLQQHFIASKVQYLYEFVHSIFSLIFTMMRESANQKSQKPNDVKKQKTSDTGIQTDEGYWEDKKKLPAQSSNSNARHKKRAGLEIEIVQKDLTEMSFRGRRNALKKMRDMIQAQDDQSYQHSNVLKDFKPNISKIQYSKSDESIKAAIDTFKESDISTHIFLKHFIEDLVDVKDIKSSSELLSKELSHSMSKAIAKYNDVKYQGKTKFRLFSHTIEQIIYPTSNEGNYQINIDVSCQKDTANKKSTHEIQQQHILASTQQMLSLSVIKEEPNKFVMKQQIKRSRFSSLISGKGNELNPISEAINQDLIRQSSAAIFPISGKKDVDIKKPQTFLNQDELTNSLGRTSQHKKSRSSQIPLLSKKNSLQPLNKTRQSFRIQNKRDKTKMIESSKDLLKENNGVNLKKLKKRNISNYVDKRESRTSLMRQIVN